MNLCQEILVNVFAKEQITVSFPNLKLDAVEIVEGKAIDALKKIKTIIENDSLSDFDCIEAIVCVFEEIGSTCGNRHDFG